MEEYIVFLDEERKVLGKPLKVIQPEGAYFSTTETRENLIQFYGLTEDDFDNE